MASSNLKHVGGRSLCLVSCLYDNLVFLRMPVAQSRLANGFGASPLWPEVHKVFFRFPVIWCCTNVEMSCLGLDSLWCLLFLFIKTSFFLLSGVGRGRKTNLLHLEMIKYFPLYFLALSEAHLCAEMVSLLQRMLSCKIKQVPSAVKKRG